MRAAALEVDKDEWLSKGLELIESLVDKESLISADHLRAEGLPEPQDSGAWGGLFSAAKAAGLILHTGCWTRSTHPARRGGVQGLWMPAERKHRDSHNQ